MDIREFIETAVTDVITAVENIRDREELVRDIGLEMTATSRTIEFDIAVTVERIDGIDGEANITVLGLVGGKGHMENQNKNSSVSRIQFGVVVYPMSKKEREAAKARQDALNQAPFGSQSKPKNPAR